MSTELTKRANVAELCAAYQAAVSEVRTSFARLHEAQARLNATFNLESHDAIEIRSNGEWKSREFNVDACIGQMHRKAWSVVVDRMEIRRILSESRMKELSKQIEDGELPDLTEENVHAFANRFVTTAPELLREMVMEVFDYLRPREGSGRAKYKTNERAVVGERVVLTMMVRAVSRDRFGVRFDQSQRLRSLENVFSALDGQGQTGRRYNSLLQDAIDASPEGVGETDYFAFRACKNGNLHLRFRRLDLLARFNRTAGGANLCEKDSKRS